jgi:hypothetical protein
MLAGIADENGLKYWQPLAPGVVPVQPGPPRPFSADCSRSTRMSWKSMWYYR